MDIIYSYFQGYYDTMDAGYMDEEGYVYVMSRVDDVINVAGHRISAGAIEEVLRTIGLLFQVVGKELNGSEYWGEVFLPGKLPYPSFEAEARLL